MKLLRSPLGNVVDVRIGTGLLTYAIHAGGGTGCFPSRRLAATVGGPWPAFTRCSPLPARRCARITVAGQWRSFTALPEHSATGQRWRLNDFPVRAAAEWARLKFYGMRGEKSKLGG